MSQRILDSVKSSVEDSRINFNQNTLTRTPESAFVLALEDMAKDSRFSKQHEHLVEFLINSRRYHHSYIESGEIWGFIEQHVNLDLSKLEDVPGPFGVFIEISGHRNGTGFQVFPVTQQDIQDQINPFAKLFEGILDKGDSKMAHVIYMDKERTIEHGFNFSVLISQPMITESESKIIKENAEAISYLFSIMKKINHSTSEELYLRKQAVNHILNSEYGLLKLAFDLISDGFTGKFEHDMFDFMTNVKSGHARMMSNREKLATDFPKDEDKRVVMVNYSSTRRGGSPEMLLITPSFAKEVISNVKSQGGSPAQWEKNLELLQRMDSDTIGVMHVDDELSNEHDFPFDLTLSI